MYNGNMDTVTTTQRYYASWLDVTPDALDNPGVRCVYSPKRNERQPGYSRPFDLYALLKDQTIIISYGERLQAKIDTITQCFEGADSFATIRATVASCTGHAPQHSYKHVFTTLPGDIDTGQARQLKREDYPDFLRFHQTLYPDANQKVWLEPYFNKITARGYVFGLYRDGLLVSATEAPDMPYLRTAVVEPGINTLPDYRQQGWARMVCGALLKHLLRTGKVPLWSCDAGNLASHRLAESLGFVKFADVLTL